MLLHAVKTFLSLSTLAKQCDTLTARFHEKQIGSDMPTKFANRHRAIHTYASNDDVLHHEISALFTQQHTAHTKNLDGRQAIVFMLSLHSSQTDTLLLQCQSNRERGILI